MAFVDATFGKQETLHRREKLVHSQTDLAMLGMTEPERSYVVRKDVIIISKHADHNMSQLAQV